VEPVLKKPKSCVVMEKERVVVFFVQNPANTDGLKSFAKIVVLRKRNLLSKNVPTTKLKGSVTCVHLIITAYTTANDTHAFFAMVRVYAVTQRSRRIAKCAKHQQVG